MRKPFEINNEFVQPGESKIIRIPLPALHSETEITMPVHVIQGKKEGPIIFISAAVHGDEINGVEVIRRILSLNIIKKLKGTLIAAPVVNVFGFNSHSRYLPDRRDLNRSFPGTELGSLAGRLANIFMQEVVSRSDLGIDLHTAAIHRDNLPQIRANLTHEKLNAIANKFEAPVILHSAPPTGSLRFAAEEINVPVMVYESGEALRYDEVSIRVAVRGILNIMSELKMLRTRPRKQKAPVLLRSSSWVRAPISGILRSSTSLGDTVETGDNLGFISDPAGQQDTSVEATCSGIIIGRTNNPLIYEGEALFHIGKSQQTTLLEDCLDSLESADLLNTPELVQEPIIV